MITSKTLTKKDGNIFLISSIFLLLINFILPIIKYTSLNTSVYDLGIYLNTLYNIGYNKIYSIAFEGHYEPILIPISFIYKLFDYDSFGVLSILIIQTASIFSIGIYFLIKKKYLISILFFIYFPITYINLFDFHTDSFAIIFYLLFLVSITKRNIITSVIFLFILCSVKEIYALIAVISSIYFYEKQYYTFKYFFIINIFVILYFIFQIYILKYNSIEIPIYGNITETANKLNIFEKIFKISLLVLITSIPFIFFIKLKDIKYLFLILLPYMIYNNENIYKFNYQYFIPIFLIYIMLTFEKINTLKFNMINQKYYYLLILYNLFLGSTFLSPIFWVKNNSMYYYDNYVINNKIKEKKKFLENINLNNYKSVTTSNFLNYHVLSNNLILDTLENNNFNNKYISKTKKSFFEEDYISSDIIFIDKSKTQIDNDKMILIKKDYEIIHEMQDLIVFKRK